MKTVIYLHDFFMIIKKFNYEENHFNLQIRAFGFNIDFFCRSSMYNFFEFCYALQDIYIYTT